MAYTVENYTLPNVRLDWTEWTFGVSWGKVEELDRWNDMVRVNHFTVHIGPLLLAHWWGGKIISYG